MFRHKLTRRIITGVVAIAMTLAYVPCVGGYVWADTDTVAIKGQASETQNVTANKNYDNDKLLAGYIDGSLGIDGGMSTLSSSTAGDRLPTTEKAIYDSLKSGVTKIANGKTNSSIIQVPLSAFGFEGKKWSAEDLGVDSILTPDGEYLSDEASAKLYDVIDKIDYNKIYNALLADCPCELYWHDKTRDTNWDYPEIVSYAPYDYIQFEEDGAITFYFCVDTAYEKDDYTVDSGVIGAVNNTIKNIKNIVYENMDLSDYDKLVAYKDIICDLTSYNDEAAEEHEKYDNGNPWQLVWVFDGDDETNVVCEGYSKAFQYLFELSEFDNDINNYTVTGDMSVNEEEAGGHMWNVVNMEDGKNYLVDITNCDTDTVGAPDVLFLASPYRGNLNYYTFAGVADYDVNYAYDDEIIDLYGEDMLTLATDGVNYQPPVNPHKHIFDNPRYTWAKDYSECDAVLSCTVDGCNATRTIELNVNRTVKPASCSKTGTNEYEAQRTVKGVDYADSKSVTIPKLAHKSSNAVIKNLVTAAFDRAGKYDKVVSCSVCGTVIKKETVTIPKLASAKISASKYVYNGKVQKPVLTIKDSKGVSVSANNYTVSYSPTGCKNVGKYVMTVKFKGNYSGQKTLSYVINPAKTSISSLSKGKKAFTVKWAKKSTQVTGYEIKYSTSSSFKNAKTVKVTSYKTTSKTIKNLKAKKKYYVRVRTYKTVSGVKYVSAWSAVKSIITK